MEFGTFLGNEGLKQRLASVLSNGKLHHSYLLCGPSGSGRHTLAKLLCAAMQCTAEQKPCLRCAQCRKVLHGTHPDIITVDDPERKTLPVKLIRSTCADLYTRPNEGLRKIYLIPRAQDLNPQGQNALLKCMEEPPAYGVFLLLTDNAERLLPTVRSRSVELRLQPLAEAQLLSALRERFPGTAESVLRSAALRSGGYLGQAETLLRENSTELFPQSLDFLEAYRARDAAALLGVLVPMEKLKREALRPVLSQWHDLLTSALTARAGLPLLRPECAQIAAARSAADILSGIDALKTALRQLDANVGPAHICGALSILLR